ncbi:hypothetical protein AB0953_32680 [Streptomyces sp. NPDC046866]|uniref:hypothetical protein n=1 Tax=Streptomyces sp. NPDC046866 TaxID=3154921 RepID=UPI003454E105
MGRCYGPDPYEPDSRRKRGHRYVDLVGPLDGLLLDLTGSDPREVVDGAVLMSEHGAFRPVDHSGYEPAAGDCGDVGRCVWREEASHAEHGADTAMWRRLGPTGEQTLTAALDNPDGDALDRKQAARADAQEERRRAAEREAQRPVCRQRGLKFTDERWAETTGRGGV